jgi:hypothetical protein
LKPSATENMDDFLHIKFIFLFTPIILAFVFNWRRVFYAEFFEFFFKFKIALFAGMKLQNFKEDMKKVDDRIRMGEQIILWDWPSCYFVCLLADSMLEIFQV